MLVNNVNGEAVGASMVRDSSFYIELAKFVQAYSTIIANANAFLAEVNEPSIDEKTGRVSWAQFVKIMQACDFGFVSKPTEMELKVYYNYALEIGSLDSIKQKVATVNDVAEAQKHYYNFVDKAKDRAETEYMKQHKLYLSREQEMSNVDNKLSLLKTASVFAYVMMVFSAFAAVFGIASLFLNNAIVSAIGKIIPVWKAQYVGAVILILFGLLLFFLFDKMHEKYKRQYFKLKMASETIFTRGEESYAKELVLKNKFDLFSRELKTVQSELNDKHKRFDVKENINRLKATNKYYQKYAEQEESLDYASNEFSTDEEKGYRAEDFAPVTLTKEQEENLRRVGKEAIMLEGQYDLEAYKEKFEQSRESSKEETKEEQIEAEEQKEIEETEEVQKFKENQERLEEQELIESIDYIKEILGFSSDDEPEKQL